MTKIIRRGNKGLGKTANGGNNGSFAAHEREVAESPRDRMERLYEEGGSDLTYEQDYANALGIASRKARSYSSQWVDQDDITQDAIIRVLDQAQRNGYINVSKEKKDGGRAGVISQAVAHSIVRVNHQGEHHTSVSGRKVLKQRRQEKEAVLGRGMTPMEVDELAEHVRMNDFPAGRRPTKGYHVHSVESLSTEERDDDGRLTNYGALTVEDEYPSEMGERDSTAIGQLADRVAAGKTADKEERSAEGGVSAAEGRKLLWGTYRQQNPDIPELRSMSVKDRNTAQAAVEHSGGAYEVAESWLDGRPLSREAEEAFFSPWGSGFDTTMDQKDAVAEKIIANRAYAESLWATAAGIAVK